MMNKRWIVALWLTLLPLIGSAQVPMPQPMPGTHIHDFAGVIAGDKKAEIEAKARQLKDAFKTEIAVVTIDSLEGEDSFEYSMKMARTWGIGSKDNAVRGLLILVAVKDHKTSFRTSRHIEGVLPDSVTGEISRQMNEYFKKGDFGGGLSAGMARILERLKAVYAPATVPGSATGGLGLWWLLIIGGPLSAIGIALAALVKKRRREAAQREQREKAAQVNRANYFSADAKRSFTDRPAPKSKRQRDKRHKTQHNPPSSSYEPSYSSGYGSSASSSSDSGSSSSYDSGSSSSYDSGSSSSSDSGSSYSGGSDFGGGGSDSNW